VARVLLLVPTATYRAGDFLDAAAALGVEVVVGTEEPHALRHLMGTRSLEVPLRDTEAAVDAVVAHDRVAPLDAVIAVDDSGTVVAAKASEQLGLPHNPPDAVEAARDKLVMRTKLGAAEVPQPRYAVVPPGADAQTIEAAVTGVGLPCVVKPTTLSASQGVIRADSPEDAVRVARRVRTIADAAGVDASAPLLVERFVPGSEVAVEALLDSGDLLTLAVFDKPEPLDGPYFEESIYVTPSRLPASDVAAATGVVAAATRALGLRDGPVHAEVRVHEGRAWVIEVAARTIGGLCSRALRFATGRTLEEVVLAQALGLGVDAAPDGRASGVLMLPIPCAGRLVGVEGQSDAMAVPGITGIEVTVARGRYIEPVPEGNRYLGFVFARDRRPERVESALRRARTSLRIVIEPDEPRASDTA
jgi:biotin carboxylase